MVRALLNGGNGTGGMRHLCGKSVRRRAPHKWHTRLPWNHFVGCVKIKAHCVIGASCACHREKTYPPLRSPPFKSARMVLGSANGGVSKRWFEFCAGTKFRYPLFYLSLTPLFTSIFRVRNKGSFGKGRGLFRKIHFLEILDSFSEKTPFVMTPFSGPEFYLILASFFT